MPHPTLADLAADLYHQRWSYPNGVSYEFNVLAFDEAHAENVGAVRMAEGLADLASVSLTTNECVEGSVELRAAVLLTESQEAFDARQREYARRQENANEAAAERQYESFHGSSSPQTDAERYDAAAAFKRSLR
jgi:hypothetical protein